MQERYEKSSFSSSSSGAASLKSEFYENTYILSENLHQFSGKDEEKDETLSDDNCILENTEKGKIKQEMFSTPDQNCREGLISAFIFTKMSSQNLMMNWILQIILAVLVQAPLKNQHLVSSFKNIFELLIVLIGSY